jgi:predicted transcriptional regulator
MTRIEFEGINYVTSYKKKDNGANNEYYNWYEEERFTPTSIRVKGNGLETNRIETPADVLDSVMIELKTAKVSVADLEACIKTLLDGQLDGITIELNVQNTRTALIKASSEHVGTVKKLCDDSILVTQGATIMII